MFTTKLSLRSNFVTVLEKGKKDEEDYEIEAEIRKCEATRERAYARGGGNEGGSEEEGV